MANPLPRSQSLTELQIEPCSLGDIHQASLPVIDGGSIQVESVPGAGSRFTISDRGPVIMLVDDNEISSETMADFLDGRNFCVDRTSSGTEFLERVGSVHPDLVLMDIQMPGMDGIEAIRHLRTHTDLSLASIPIIAVTALAMPGDRERCLAAGADEYLSKPVRLQEMESLVHKLLAAKRPAAH